MLGAIVGIGIYLYQKRKANQVDAATTPTSGSGDPSIDPATGTPYASETGANAIDPATGIPYSQELAAQNNNPVDPSTGLPWSQETGFNAIDPSTGATWASELTQAENPQEMIAALENMGFQVEGVTKTVVKNLGSKRQTKEIKSLEKQVRHLKEQLQKQRQRAERRRNHKHDNTGHKTTTHANGSRSVTSTAHNAGQKSAAKTVAGPSHTRAPTAAQNAERIRKLEEQLQTAKRRQTHRRNRRG
jgi:hypothetical protein